MIGMCWHDKRNVCIYGDVLISKLLYAVVVVVVFAPPLSRGGGTAQAI